MNRLITFVILIFGSSLSACVTHHSPDAGMPPVLKDSTWWIDEIDGQPPASSSNHLVMVDEHFTLYLGCNHISGRFSVNDDMSLQVLDLRSTKKECETGIAENERSVKELFASTIRLAQTQIGALVMFSDGQELTKAESLHSIVLLPAPVE